MIRPKLNGVVQIEFTLFIQFQLHATGSYELTLSNFKLFIFIAMCKVRESRQITGCNSNLRKCAYEVVMVQSIRKL